MELLRYCNWDGCQAKTFNSPTQRGLCSVFNTEPYSALKSQTDLDLLLAKNFKLRPEVTNLHC